MPRILPLVQNLFQHRFIAAPPWDYGVNGNTRASVCACG
jgi:hypothetical protein